MTTKGTILAHDGHRFRKYAPGADGDVPVYVASQPDGLANLPWANPSDFTPGIVGALAPENGSKPQFTFDVATGTPTAGTFDVTFSTGVGNSTATIPFNATTVQVAAAIVAGYLASSGQTITVLCAGGPLSTNPLTAQIQLLADWAVASIDNGNITGGTFSATLSTPGANPNTDPAGTLWVQTDTANAWLQTSSDPNAPTWKKITLT